MMSGPDIRFPRESFAAVLVMGVIVAAVIALVALLSCSPRPLTTEEKAAAAEGTYGAQLQACVVKSKSPRESDVCAAGVRARWDGGAR